MIIRDGRIDITNDTGWLIETLNASTNYVRPGGADSVAGSDSAGRALFAGRAPSPDAAVSTDLLGRTLAFGRAPSDSATAPDTSSPALDMERVPSDDQEALDLAETELL